MLVIMMARHHAEAVRPSSHHVVDENGWGRFDEIYFMMVHLLALLGDVALVARILWWRRRPRGITPVWSHVGTCTMATSINLTAMHPENIWVTTGECYHVDVSCGALVHDRVSKKRPYLKCTP